MVFWIPNQPDFEFLEKGEITEQVTHSNIVLSGTLTILDAGQLEAPDLVREFLDVFSENLPGLLLDREVEFTIDVFHGTAPQFSKHHTGWH